MNTQNARRSVLASVVLGLVFLAASQASRADLLVRVDCAKRVLPSQAEVSAGLGLDNFGQAYQARTRLLNVVNRACKQAAGGRVDLVLQAPRGPRAPGAIVVTTAAR
jgi:hypothetical protein